jgi:hypothetical protein
VRRDRSAKLCAFTYYASLYAGEDTARWQTLPTTDKPRHDANFTDLNYPASLRREAMETALARGT